MNRLFVGIKLPDHIKDKLSKLCFGIPEAKWIKNNQFHLTLKFIGEVFENITQDIADSLNEIEHKNFELILDSIGYFPINQQPKTIWAGVQTNDLLNNLQKKIDRKLSLIKIEPEKRKFFPHITLARVEFSNPQKILQYLAENGSFKTEPFIVSEFILYNSIKSHEGSIYEELAVYDLT